MDDPEKTLLELWRIGKPNAVIEIIVPYYNNKSAYSSMQHKYVFNDDCFKVFIEENKINGKERFEIILLNLVPTTVGKFIPKRLREKLSLFIGGLISHIHVRYKILR